MQAIAAPYGPNCIIPLGLPQFLEESLKTDGFHNAKNFLPLIASRDCPEDCLLGSAGPEGQFGTEEHTFYEQKICQNPIAPDYNKCFNHFK